MSDTKTLKEKIDPYNITKIKIEFATHYNFIIANYDNGIQMFNASRKVNKLGIHGENKPAIPAWMLDMILEKMIAPRLQFNSGDRREEEQRLKTLLFDEKILYQCNMRFIHFDKDSMKIKSSS